MRASSEAPAAICCVDALVSCVEADTCSAEAEDRTHRIGQRDAVTAWYLLAAETIDENMAEVLARKRGIVGAITDGRPDESEAVLQSVVKALRGKPLRRLRAVA